MLNVHNKHIPQGRICIYINLDNTYGEIYREIWVGISEKSHKISHCKPKNCIFIKQDIYLRI